MKADIGTADIGQTGFGRLLSDWRTQRGFSQLALAHESAVSQRHISFLESGRSTPSREMVLRLCETLGVPLALRNSLLASAGFAPLFEQRDLQSPELNPFQDAISVLLNGVEPAPALLVNRRWELLQSNAGALRFFSHLAGAERMAELMAHTPVNVMHLLFREDALRPYIDDWENVACQMLQRLQRDASLEGSHGPLHDLVEALLGYPGIPSDWRRIRWELELPPALPIGFLGADNSLWRFHAAVTTIGTPFDLTLDDLRIESFFAADAATADLLQHINTA